MSDGFLSQEEIDSLLNGGGSSPSENKEIVSDTERDLLGEIGNICMGSSATALSTIINQQVNITTPIVGVSTLKKLKDKFDVPNIALDVKFISGIDGQNLLVIKMPDAAVIADLMMGGSGTAHEGSLSEIEISAVSEAMNQMIGSAATSMATMFSREINISPPNCKIWDENTSELADDISNDEEIIDVSFRLKIGELIDSNIMQVFPLSTAKKIVSIMMGEEKKEDNDEQTAQNVQPKQSSEAPAKSSKPAPAPEEQAQDYVRSNAPQPAANNERREVKTASFQPLCDSSTQTVPRNIDLILDVPLEISVVLGRTKKSIKDILNLGTGSLVELDKLAEEPVEIMVNGKKVAYGEVVVVDENFGVRITNIVSNTERIKSLG